MLNLHRIRPVLSIAVLAVLAIGAPSAGAVVGRVNLDGTEANPDFINTPRGTTTWDVAVDAGHIYWTWSNRDDPEPSPGWIARANLDGSAVQPQFISGVGPGGLAVANGRLYWANADTRTIGRANVDGSGVDPSFISSIGDDAFDVEADSSHVYWARDAETSPPGGPRLGWVGRANVDGSGADPSLIGPISFGGNDGLALDAAHVYFTGGLSIYRANLDGSDAPTCATPVDDCVPVFAPYATNDLAVSPNALFFGIFRGGVHSAPTTGIGRADLAAPSSMTDLFNTGSAMPTSMAIDAAHVYWAASGIPESSRPDTTITRHPRKRIRKRRVTFAFDSSDDGATFRCRLDSKPAHDCKSPTTLRRLARGRHVFQVRASASGYPDKTPALFRFRVLR